AMAVGGVFKYLASDGLGSANVSLDANGNVIASVLYAPYGSARYSSGTMPTDHGFTGQIADATSGLDYYGARYYDPVAGQFSSADSFLQAGSPDIWSLSRFAYVEGNPLNRTDPNGKCIEYNSEGEMNACWAQSEADHTNHCNAACEQRNENAAEAREAGHTKCDSICQHNSGVKNRDRAQPSASPSGPGPNQASCPVNSPAPPSYCGQSSGFTACTTETEFAGAAVIISLDLPVSLGVAGALASGDPAAAAVIATNPVLDAIAAAGLIIGVLILWPCIHP
ncbi:MAG: RHS repeat-associated core domain-containing protein, partial [Chloroflexi bacterium]